jgi:hypothetical protein
MRLKTFGSEQSRARVSTAAAAIQIVGSAGQVKWVHRKATKSQFDKHNKHRIHIGKKRAGKSALIFCL